MATAKKTIQADVCVIGGGSGGLAFAAGAAQMGVNVVLVEANKMGGDCLNYGCVPSKALLAAAHKANQNGSDFGVELQSKVSFSKVQAHVQSVIDSIAPHDSVKRFRGLGVNVIKAKASFIDARSVQAGATTITAKYFVIATGSSAAVPPIPGIDTVAYFTNETLFTNTRQPKHLLIIGGGPIGMEMAQAHAQLGSKVSVFDMAKVLPKDDQDLVTILRQQFDKDGIELYEEVGVHSIAKGKTKGSIDITYVRAGKKKKVSGTHLLVAAGRSPNLQSLNLEAAGIEYSRAGIVVDQRLRSNKKHIYAIGDVAGGYQFTHVAGYHAGIAIRNILFKMPAKVDYKAITWVTYTSPEMAHVGLSHNEAQEKAGEKLRVLQLLIAENDRAKAERKTEGCIKVYVTKKGTILGVDILAEGAGELIQPWCLAIQSGLNIKHMATYMAPYPTMGEINKRVAGSFYTESLFSDTTKKLVLLLKKI